MAIKCCSGTEITLTNNAAVYILSSAMEWQIKFYALHLTATNPPLPYARLPISISIWVCMYACMAECLLIIGTGCRVQVLAWSSIAQSVCQQAFSLLANRCLRPWVRILHSAEEDVSPFDSNIACLCQSIEINNNKHVYRQSQVRKPTGSEVKWAECLLIIGTGCRVQVLAWSSIAQSVCQQAFSLLANRCLRTWVRILHSAEEDNVSPFDSNIACLCQSIEINNKHVCIYIYIYMA